MSRQISWVVIAAVAAMLPAATVRADCGGHRQTPGPRLEIIALTSDQRLVRLDECNPEHAREIGTVSGLAVADTSLVGIDFRVQDEKLYGVGRGGGIYTIDTATAQATKVSQLTVALSGTFFGVDFNPAANRLRIISDTGQNLRHDVAGATTTDTSLTTPPAVGTTTGVTGAAYTNNDLASRTATTLFDINSATDQVVVQSPANSGQLAASGKLTVDAGSAVGFDIYSTLAGGVTIANEAFASLTVAGNAGLYTVNLLTGEASLRGLFDEHDDVVDIALPLKQR